jgi:hypothetical protein
MNKNIAIVFTLFNSLCVNAQPRVGIVIIIDQFAYHEWQWLAKEAQFGFKTLKEKGINYLDAHHMHGAPVTGAGHASIATNSLPYYHGIVNNEWFDAQNNRVVCDKVDNNYCLNNLMVDTLNDQFKLQNPQAHAYSISLKPRAALLMAGRLGHAYWFDSDAKEFKYHNEETSFTSRLQSLKNKYMIDDTFASSPASNTLLLESGSAALRYIKEKQDDEPILLWISLSALDKVGHHDGPWSNSIRDMLLKIDKDLGQFITEVEQLYSPDQIFWTLSADHGVQPVVEEVQQKGYTPSHRIIKSELIQNINQALGDAIKMSVAGIRTPFVYLNFNLNAKSDIQNELEAIKEKLMTIPGIINVFFNDSLAKNAAQTYKERLFKNQLYEGRTGNLIIELAPYVLLSDKAKGTKHNTPYDYNTHIPLLMRWDNHIKPSSVNADRVWAPQISATLAYIFKIPMPSASLFNILPCVVTQ